ncbi:mRNA-decapping enzyme subunit 2 [Mycoemilia scoparia]|uniref:mRNA-decapping enzyme subunit 2 n=1 Tax=Mycoemilia scoparia TaxID=417184 RepID=A0A9W7ZXE5_9FUNG|nr:mRNA-decapping enzyme subunit 2 [Mycoemilia scoparia]
MNSTRLSLRDALEDLASRFIINVPDEEAQAIERICFQIEQAHWFYTDYIQKTNPHLPAMNLKVFASKMFQHCPMLSQWGLDPETAYKRFLAYKFQVPVCGAIILNPPMDKGWNSRSSWGFPRGKINQDEPENECAVREVMEETGYNIEPHLMENEWIEQTVANQRIRLYFIAGVPESTKFEPMTRGEISSIEWHCMDKLPSYKSNKDPTINHQKPGSSSDARYYMIKPFVRHMRSWITKRRKQILFGMISGNSALNNHNILLQRQHSPIQSHPAAASPSPPPPPRAMSTQEFFSSIRASAHADQSLLHHQNGLEKKNDNKVVDEPIQKLKRLLISTNGAAHHQPSRHQVSSSSTGANNPGSDALSRTPGPLTQDPGDIVTSNPQPRVQKGNHPDPKTKLLNMLSQNRHIQTAIGPKVTEKP